MIRLLTPWLLLTVCAVALLAVSRWVLLPDTWLTSLVALLFLPAVIAGIVVRARRRAGPHAAITIAANLRAALLGAGVALGVALLLSITDALGMTNSQGSGDWRSFATLFPALLAAAADMLSAKLERKALDKSDEDKGH